MADEAPSQRRNAIILGAVLLLLGVSLGYQWWSSRDDAEVSSGRSVSEFIVDWQCLSCSHRIEQNAGPGPRQCPKCHKDEMYTAINWACPAHGGRTVFFQYNAEGEPTQVRFEKGDWMPALDQDGGWNIKCPVCGQVMMPAARPKTAR